MHKTTTTTTTTMMMIMMMMMLVTSKSSISFHGHSGRDRFVHAGLDLSIFNFWYTLIVTHVYKHRVWKLARENWRNRKWLTPPSNFLFVLVLNIHADTHPPRIWEEKNTFNIWHRRNHFWKKIAVFCSFRKLLAFAKYKFDGAVGVPIYNFLLVFNSNK